MIWLVVQGRPRTPNCFRYQIRDAQVFLFLCKTPRIVWVSGKKSHDHSCPIVKDLQMFLPQVFVWSKVRNYSQVSRVFVPGQWLRSGFRLETSRWFWSQVWDFLYLWFQMRYLHLLLVQGSKCMFLTQCKRPRNISSPRPETSNSRCTSTARIFAVKRLCKLQYLNIRLGNVFIHFSQVTIICTAESKRVMVID